MPGGFGLVSGPPAPRSRRMPRFGDVSASGSGVTFSNGVPSAYQQQPSVQQLVQSAAVCSSRGAGRGVSGGARGGGMMEGDGGGAGGELVCQAGVRGGGWKRKDLLDG